MEKSRIEYSAINTTISIVCRMIAILMGFAARVVFTHTLSEAYVGINGLFLDILNVLSLSELGVGTAITFSLYKPIACGDIEKQKSIMKLYQHIYQVVAGLVLAFGLLIVPFLGILIKIQPDIPHLIIIYLLYLGDSVISYLFIYKRTLIEAHQLLYIGVLYQTIAYAVKYLFQVIVLIYTRNFIFYLVVSIICTVCMNVAISKKAEKLFPFLKEKHYVPLEVTEKKEIRNYIQAMIMHKLGGVVLNNTDNLILSAFVGIVSVGCYSNYYLVIGSIRQILDQMFSGITASVGNLGATEDEQHIKNIFEIAFFIGQWVYGFAAICLFEIISPFIALSFGKQYVFPKEVVFVLCLQFYILGLRKATFVFRDSLGLFWYDRYKAVIEAVLNLGISICLVQVLGTIGIFLGTIFSMMLTSMWVEPFILYRKRLHAPLREYFGQLLLYVSVMAVAWGGTYYCCEFVQGNVWLVLIIRFLICITLPNLFLCIVYIKKKEFVDVRDIVFQLIRRKG